MWSYQHATFTVHQIPALSDNYLYLIETGNALACVDPAEADPIIAACSELNRPLTHILNTHHHWDHTGGNLELKAHFGCSIIGAAHDADRIPGIEQKIAEGDALKLGQVDVSVLDIPGHTSGHIAYVLADEQSDALFCGDTLFGAGCGRLFEGTPEQMWHSLQKLMCLTPNSRFYCAHEYTLNNIKFCMKEVSQNTDIKEYYKWSLDMINKGLPTIPGTLEREMRCNPMLLPANSEFRRDYAARHTIADDEISVFTHIREARNHW
ncbi:MAG: hydroxyacylglutathione hydrolase [Mariprofundaceae bacterium]